MWPMHWPMFGWGWGTLGMFPMLLWGLFSLVIIGLCIYGCFHMMMGGMHDHHHEERDDALDILKARYAKGEITKEEYDKMKKDLES